MCSHNIITINLSYTEEGGMGSKWRFIRHFTTEAFNFDMTSRTTRIETFHLCSHIQLLPLAIIRRKNCCCCRQSSSSWEGVLTLVLVICKCLLHLLLLVDTPSFTHVTAQAECVPTTQTRRGWAEYMKIHVAHIVLRRRELTRGFELIIVSFTVALVRRRKA